jgi:hypothetical protein
MEPDIKSRINNQAGDLEQMIKQYCRSQKELWQRIPYLALMADSYMNPDYALQKAYESGYWDTSYHAPSGRNIFVDCGTGELCYYISKSYSNTRQPVISEEILGLAFRLDCLDAKQAIDSLRERIKGKGVSDKPRLSAWREKLMYELGIDENKLYKREERRERVLVDDNQL